MMHMRTLFALAICVVPLIAAEPMIGWRGNGTGLYPEADPPLEWFRKPVGAMDGMRASALKPKGSEHGDAPLVVKGLIPEWLAIGPFAVADSVKDFDRDHLGGEVTIEPVADEKSAEQVWKSLIAPKDDMHVFGTAEMPFFDLAKTLGFKPNQVGYAHAWLFSPRGGKVRGIVEHGHGFKAWVNGKEVYRSPQRGSALGFYTAISRTELAHSDPESPRFEVELRPGWNRLLVKLSTSNKDDFKDMRFCLRFMDPPDVKYESKNIAWLTPLPGRSTSTPIMHGNRLFVMAEPDELLCLDKTNGRVLWSRFINYYEALTPAEKQAQPAFAGKVDPQIARLTREKERSKRLSLRAELHKTLVGIDAARFKLAADGHFESHFGIVGFTMPTPVCDGKHVYVWSGMGVAVCFDLEGKREWITRIPDEALSYGSSPALVDGVLVVFQHGLFGLDAKSGKVLWQQKRIKNNVAALQGAMAGGKPVVVTQRGDLIRPSDGEILYRPKDSQSAGDIGWAPSTIIGSRMYQPQYGVTSVTITDLKELSPAGDPLLVQKIALPEMVSRGPDGKSWSDRWTAGSPLVWGGFLYQADIYQVLYAVELATGKMYYRREMPLEGLTHYNAVAMAASPTLIGKHLFLCDNQGSTLIVQAGSSYRRISQNKIGTVMDRKWPIPAQETLTYSPPIADGGRIYLRGEGYMYCVGEK